MKTKHFLTLLLAVLMMSGLTWPETDCKGLQTGARQDQDPLRYAEVRRRRVSHRGLGAEDL